MSKKDELKRLIDQMNESDLESVTITFKKPACEQHNVIDKGKEMSDFLFEFFNNKVNKITGEKQVTYYNDKGQWVYQLDYKIGVLNVEYHRCWSVFEFKYNINYQEIKDFISSWVETNLGWKGLTPYVKIMGDDNM